MPLTNLSDPLLVKVARSTSDNEEDTWFTVDLGTLRDIALLGIPYIDMTRSGQVRVTYATDSGFSDVVATSGVVDYYQALRDISLCDFEDPDFWDGRIQEEDVGLYPVPFIFVTLPKVIARYIKVEFFDEGNPNGYIDVPRLFIASGWQPTQNLKEGNGLSWKSNTLVTTSLGGADFFDERDSGRVITFTLENLSIEEGYTQIMDLQKRMDVSKQIFFVYDYEDTTQLHRRSFLARMGELSPLQYQYFNGTASNFTLKEVIA